jgi:hypothetical protein
MSGTRGARLSYTLRVSVPIATFFIVGLTLKGILHSDFLAAGIGCIAAVIVALALTLLVRRTVTNQHTETQKESDT